MKDFMMKVYILNLELTSESWLVLACILDMQEGSTSRAGKERAMVQAWWDEGIWWLLKDGFDWTGIVCN